MGDCFAYACARHYAQPLLFTGSDFSKMDVETGLSAGSKLVYSR
jgi:ribonuclease VapC